MVIPYDSPFNNGRDSLPPNIRNRGGHPSRDWRTEVQEIAHIKEYAVNATVAKKYNERLIPRRFNIVDLVLRKITRKGESNKLSPLWEGPFRVIEEVGRGAYRLEQLDRKKIPRTWNAISLRMYYS
ncbi:hypothetical protein CR513_20784, partial [Mucuna pruriens]